MTHAASSRRRRPPSWPRLPSETGCPRSATFHGLSRPELGIGGRSAGLGLLVSFLNSLLEAACESSPSSRQPRRVPVMYMSSRQGMGVSVEEMEELGIKRVTEGELERFIPVAKQEIVQDLLASDVWNDSDRKLFRDFTTLLSALYHYRFHSQSERLKGLYYPFNADADVVTKRAYDDAALHDMHRGLVEEMESLLTKANYVRLSEDDINEMLSQESAYGLSVSIDLEDYSEMILFYRGSVTNLSARRPMRYLWLAKETVETPIFQRLVLVLKFKNEYDRVMELVEAKGMSEKKARRVVRRSRKRLPSSLHGQHIILKMFRNIPRGDIGLLFPNQTVRLKLFDKIQLGVTGGGGTLAGVWATVGKVAAATNPLGLLAALGGLVGLIARQVTKFFNKQNEYMMVLARSLYFHNLNNNAGVINFLVDMAEDEECKEAILAYYFLLTNPDKRYDRKTLDEDVEAYIGQRYSVEVDFEVDDGVRKLLEDGLAEEVDGVLRPMPLAAACERLDRMWDEFFLYANEAPHGRSDTVGAVA